MKQSTRGPTVAAAIGVLIAFVALACKIGQPARPTVTLLFPAGNAQVTVNRPLEVQSISAGQAGIERVELRVNGQPVDTTPGGGQQTFTALQPWTPPSEGRYTLQVQAFDTAGGQSDLASVTVTALQPTAEPLAAATAIPTPAAPATDTPPPPPTPTDTSGPAMLVAKTDLNVRAGPSTQFEVVGLLRGGQSAPIIGVNAAGTWWLIAFPGAPKGQGWSSANPEYSAAPDPNRVPVVSAPPFPPTATPTARLDFPTIHYFKADRLTISRGQSALLQWDVSGAEAVYLYPGGEGGVIAPGSVHVSPAATTTYRLVAQNSRGQIEAALTINVRPAITAPRRIFDFIAAGPDAAWQNSHGAELPWNG
ncbi:MAG: Ig-like domain-containing protein, partial [Anaerolineae bacterium]